MRPAQLGSVKSDLDPDRLKSLHIPPGKIDFKAGVNNSSGDSGQGEQA